MEINKKNILREVLNSQKNIKTKTNEYKQIFSSKLVCSNVLSRYCIPNNILTQKYSKVKQKSKKSVSTRS